MEIEDRIRTTTRFKIKSGKHTLWIGGAFILLLISLGAHFFLQDENLRILGSLTYKKILQKVALGGVFVSIIIMITKWIERLITREATGLSTQFNLVRLIRLIAVVLSIMVIISIVFVNWYAAAVSFGVISLILSFALQLPLSSLIAWTYILIRSPYRVGDRIKIGSFKGDVVEINYMDTTLWEIGGDYLTNDVPSGKLVRFPNAMVLSNAVFNYSWERFTYIWNEIDVYVPYASDLEQVEKIMKDITTQDLGTNIVNYVHNFKEHIKDSTLDESDIIEEPFVSFNIKGDTWIQAIVTYPVDPKKATEVRSRLIKKIMAELKKLNAPKQQ